MLQSLSRLYVMSGERRYLEAAEEIGDALLLDPKNETFRRMVERRDSFRDHGCEMIPGLAELFVVECQLRSERAKSYREPLMKVLDAILQTSAHPETGLFCGDLDKNGNTIWLQPPDTWGYVLFSYENFDRATGTGRYRKAIEKPSKSRSAGLSKTARTSRSAKKRSSGRKPRTAIPGVIRTKA